MAASSLALWADALLVARLLAFAPAQFGGVLVRSSAGAVRDRWLEQARALLPASTPLRKIPCAIGLDRLSGNLDLAATLAAGRTVMQPGVLAQTNDGVLVIAMAERLPRSTASSIAAAMDQGTVAASVRCSDRKPATFAVIALDEGVDVDECVPAVLTDRLSFILNLDEITWRDCSDLSIFPDTDGHQDAREIFAHVEIDDQLVQAVCCTADALGVASLRVPIHTCRTARAIAALEGRTSCSQEDIEIALRLTMVPRATRIPEFDGAESQDEPSSATEPGSSEDSKPDAEEVPITPMEDVVLESARASIPAGLLARLASDATQVLRSGSSGKAGAMHSSAVRGRPTGVRPAPSRHALRLNALATLHAAAPWQPVRRRAKPNASQRIIIHPDDFRVTRYEERANTTTIFAIDASGSSALHRLAEAKGAVELLLAQCYVRRDEAAVVGFRGQRAEILLPSTRSLARAKRSLASLPGGGATPLAAGIDAALAVADSVRRKGVTPSIVLLTDGRANIKRDGTSGRAGAHEEAVHAAKRVRALGVKALVIDTSPQSQPAAQEIAACMGAQYLLLPYANAGQLSQAVALASKPHR